MVIRRGKTIIIFNLNCCLKVFFIYSVFEKPKVCRRINFGDVDDEEWEMKKAELKLMILSTRCRQRQVEKKETEETMWRKRKVETQASRKIRASRTYGGKMRCL